MNLRTLTALTIALSTLVAAAAVAEVGNTGRQLDPATLGHNVLTSPGDLGGVGPSVLYAPSKVDDPAFRAAVAGIVGGTVDYFDARAATPPPAVLSGYDCVYTWVDSGYFDNAGFGDNLADYVDAGGVAILGVFATFSTGNSMSGRIMTPGYSPVSSPTGTNHFALSDYAGDGVTPLHDGVTAYSSTFRDYLALQGSGSQDGSYLDGEIAHAYRSDFKVIYSNGIGAEPFPSGGDWPLLIANACRAGQGGGSTLYAVDEDTNNLYTLDTSTGNSSVIGPLGHDASLSGMAWDSLHSVMYASDVYGPNGWSLGTVDLASGAVTIVGPHVNSITIRGLAFDSSNDVLYGADIECLPPPYGGLVNIDRATGESTCIGNGFGHFVSSLAYNPATGALFGADSANLYSIDAATGAETFLVQIVGMPGVAAIGYATASGSLYGVGYSDNSLYTIDMVSGVAGLVGSTGLTSVGSIAFIGASGEPCGLFCDGFESGDTSAWFDPSTPTPTPTPTATPTPPPPTPTPTPTPTATPTPPPPTPTPTPTPTATPTPNSL